jgi:enoyl-CoA hydratase/carnithine racemase
MSTTRISIEETNGLGVITLSRPEKRNALDRRALAELAEAVERLDTRVIILRGRGPAFCAGVDLTELGESEHLTTEQITEAVTLGRQAADALQQTTAVTIAAIHGHCVGGGVVLAASCDLRVASDDTVFRIPEVDLGIPLVWGGISRLRRSMPTAIAKELVMTCRPFDAAEAKQIGFVNRVVSVAALEREVDELARHLLAKPKAALAITKGQFIDEIDEVNAVIAALGGGGAPGITARG